MNCKPGDLAVIVENVDNPNLVGLFVEVIRADGFYETESYGRVFTWMVRPRSDAPIQTYKAGLNAPTRTLPPGELCLCPDCLLRPIRPPGKADETSEPKLILEDHQ